jgi:general stress protein 26
MAQTNKNTNTRDTKLLADKIKGIRMAMLTTREEDGVLRSRPMATQEMEFDGNLWFLTYDPSAKAEEVQRYDQVNVSYAKPDDNLYISVSGSAEIVYDRKKIKDLWKPFYKAWFPNGEDDPMIALLRVHVTSAEYWDAPGGTKGLLYSVTKGLASGGKDMGGEDVKLNM